MREREREREREFEFMLGFVFKNSILAVFETWSLLCKLHLAVFTTASLPLAVVPVIRIILARFG